MTKVKHTQYELGSVFKLLRYLGSLTKEPISISIEGTTKNYLPPDKVSISSKFFRNFNCMRCGVCCNKHASSLVFTKREASDLFDAQKKGWLGEVLDFAQKQRITNSAVNEVYTIRVINKCSAWESPVYVYANEGGRCNFLNSITHLCEIHQDKPTLCAMPHIQIDKTDRKGVSLDGRISRSVRLLKRQHGRNWLFGCPTKPLPFDIKVFLEWDLPVLRKLQRNSEDLGFNTWLPEIITYLEDNTNKFQKGELPKEAVIIYDRAVSKEQA